MGHGELLAIPSVTSLFERLASLEVLPYGYTDSQLRRKTDDNHPEDFAPPLRTEGLLGPVRQHELAERELIPLAEALVRSREVQVDSSPGAEQKDGETAPDNVPRASLRDG